MFNSMFDELKEVKHINEITNLSLQKLEACLETKQASKLTAHYFRNKSSIVDVQLGYI